MMATLYTNLKPKMKVKNRSDVTKKKIDTLKKEIKKLEQKSTSHKITSNENHHKRLKTH
mgnify:CR=1 FL=1|jgi:hypothetical protein